MKHAAIRFQLHDDVRYFCKRRSIVDVSGFYGFCDLQKLIQMAGCIRRKIDWIAFKVFLTALYQERRNATIADFLFQRIGGIQKCGLLRCHIE
jgi:hypothetical protein